MTTRVEWLAAPCGCRYRLEPGVYGSRGEGPISVVVPTPDRWKRCNDHRWAADDIVGGAIARAIASNK